MVAQRDADHYERIGHVATVAGARTSFYSPQLDRLWLAVPQQAGSRPRFAPINLNSKSAYEDAAVIVAMYAARCMLWRHGQGAMMNRAIHLLAVVAGLLVLFLGHPVSLGAAEQPRHHLIADFGWKFTRGDPPHADQTEFDDRQWRRLDLPHDWSIEGPYDPNAPAGGGGGYLPTGIGWYRRSFTAPESWRGEKVFVEFDGVYMRSDVWINGRRLGHRPFGYIGFGMEERQGAAGLCDVL